MDGAQQENWFWRKNSIGRYRRRKNEDVRGYIIRMSATGGIVLSRVTEKLSRLGRGFSSVFWQHYGNS